MANSAPKLHIEYWPLEDLQRHPKNPKDHDVGAISESYDRYGYKEPIAIDEKSGKICAGHGRLDTLVAKRASGEPAPEGIIEEDGTWKVPVIRGISFKNERELEAYLLASNQTTILGGWFDDKLLAILQDQAENSLLPGTGFDGDDLDQLLRSIHGPVSEEARAAAAIFPDEDILKLAFEHYRKHGFPYPKLPLFVCMQEINALAGTEEPATLKTTTLGYRVADSYHSHRFEGHASGMSSPLESFNSDKLLRKALLHELKEAGRIGPDGIGWLALVSGTQAAANFRPGFACYLYRRFCKKGATVLDTSTGFGGRLIGFIASGLEGSYVGIDPAKRVHDANLKIAKDFGCEKRVKLFNQPAEEVDYAKLPACDFAFTSPPYFDKEIYCKEKTQSIERFPDPEAWRIGFLEPLLDLQFAALKKGAVNAINIADIKSGKSKKQEVPLIQWTIDAAIRAGFTHESTEKFLVPSRPGAGHDQSEEHAAALLIFRKGKAKNGAAEKPLAGEI